MHLNELPNAELTGGMAVRLNGGLGDADRR